MSEKIDDRDIDKFMRHFEKKYIFRDRSYCNVKPMQYNINLRDQNYLRQIAINSLVKREKRLN